MTATPSTTQRLAEAPAHVSARSQAGGILILLGLGWLLMVATWLRSRRPIWLLASLAAPTLGAGVLAMFRNPERTPTSGVDVVLAPADGQVANVTHVDHNGFLRGPATRVAIHVRPIDVQVNRAPVGGSIRLRRYVPAGSAPDGCADDSNWLGIRSADRQRVLLRQVASPLWRPWPYFLARRIVCWPDLEDAVHAGQEIGHLPLGGQVEVYVPAGCQVTVEPGQRVRGGEDVIALLSRPAQG